MDENNASEIPRSKEDVMIPLKMKELLQKVLPDKVWQNRLIKDGPKTTGWPALSPEISWQKKPCSDCSRPWIEKRHPRLCDFC